jgi:hypothetical protein
MAQPVWYTDAGSLGTIEEGKFFQLPLLAEDPDLSDVYFTLLSGKLPDGVQVTSNGLISGIPKAIASVQGVPTEVGENTTSQFSIRAYTKDGDAVDRLNDRTFEITVTGQDVPEFTTPAGSLGSYYDGDSVSYQLQFTDNDPNDDVVAYIAAGELPPGLSLSTSGLISGNITPSTPLESTSVAGWDAESGGNIARFDEFPWDFSTRSISRNYEFTVKLTDGKEYSLRSFEMYVFSRDSMTADTTEFTADTDIITADVVASRTPYISNYPTSGKLDAYRHDNFYAYQIVAKDPDGDQIDHVLLSGTLPPGTELDSTTGYIYGTIPDIGLQDITYSFTVRVRKDNDNTVYQDYNYSIVIYGNIDTDVTWVTDSDLGTIDNGTNSVFYIQATHSQNVPLQYRLKLGSDSRLPLGLQLLPSGNIAGRVSFQTFSLDLGNTTFDKDLRTRLDINETTWDREYSFTVQAYNTAEVVNVERTFKIFVNQKYKIPAQCLRIEAFSTNDDRALIAELVNNTDIFKPEWVYRGDDPWFGVRKKVWYEHAYGLEPSTFQEYTDSVIKNHYRKKIVLGEIRTAQALDDAGNVLYEVVYSNVVDTQINNDGKSAASKIDLKYPVTLDDGSTEVESVYPNSLENMQDKVISGIGQVAPILPRWMLSKQPDGNILGFTPAWVICYAQPGRGNQIKYNIEQKFGSKLNKVDFDADRYVLGWYAANHWSSTTTNWEGEAGTWLDPEMTTFDRNTTETIFDGGSIRFITNIDKYEYTDVYDKYVLFPQQRIIDDGE